MKWRDGRWKRNLWACLSLRREVWYVRRELWHMCYRSDNNAFELVESVCSGVLSFYMQMLDVCHNYMTWRLTSPAHLSLENRPCEPPFPSPQY